MQKIKQRKTYICKFCKNKSETIGIAQKEENFYEYDLTTKQWEDFHGDGSVESQEFFCVNCYKKIKDFVLE